MTLSDSKPDFKVMVLLLVFMQLTRDLFAIAKFLLFTVIAFCISTTIKERWKALQSVWYLCLCHVEADKTYVQWVLHRVVHQSVNQLMQCCPTFSKLWALGHFKNFPVAEGRIGRLLQSNPGRRPRTPCWAWGKVQSRPRPHHIFAAFRAGFRSVQTVRQSM